MKLPSNVKTFSDVCDFIKTVHEQKNGDYGSTWLFVRDMIGVDPMVTIWSRALDKVNRVSNLLKRQKETGEGPLVVGESMLDSILDLAVYCIIGVAEHLRQQAAVEDAEFDGDEVEFEADFEINGQLEAPQVVDDLLALQKFVEQVLQYPGETVFGPASYVKTFRSSCNQKNFNEIPRSAMRGCRCSNLCDHADTEPKPYSIIDFEKIKDVAVRYGDLEADKVSEALDGC